MGIKNKIMILIFTLIIMLLLFLTTNVYGAQLQITGETETTEGEGRLYINISNDLSVGVVQAMLAYDNNFEFVRISSSYNGWTTTYNEDLGIFNTFNANGTKNANVIELEYKLKSNSTEGTIDISDIELTTIEYDVVKIDTNSSKTILKKSDNTTDEEEDGDEEETTNTTGEENTGTEEENTNTTGEENTDTEDENTSTPEEEYINNVEENINIENQNSETQKDTSEENMAKDSIPQTGNNTYSIIITLITIALISILFYKKFKFYDV